MVPDHQLVGTVHLSTLSFWSFFRWQICLKKTSMSWTHCGKEPTLKSRTCIHGGDYSSVVLSYLNSLSVYCYRPTDDVSLYSFYYPYVTEVADLIWFVCNYCIFTIRNYFSVSMTVCLNWHQPRQPGKYTPVWHCLDKKMVYHVAFLPCR